MKRLMNKKHTGTLTTVTDKFPLTHMDSIFTPRRREGFGANVMGGGMCISEAFRRREGLRRGRNGTVDSAPDFGEVGGARITNNAWHDQICGGDQGAGSGKKGG